MNSTNHPRCLYHNHFAEFLREPEEVVLGILCDHIHGVVPTTFIEAWKGEIIIMKDVVARLDGDRKIIVVAARSSESLEYISPLSDPLWESCTGQGRGSSCQIDKSQI